MTCGKAHRLVVLRCVRNCAPGIKGLFLCEEMIQPDGQTASLLAEWRWGVLLILVSSSEFGVVDGGVEQNDGHGSSMSGSGLRNMQ